MFVLLATLTMALATANPPPQKAIDIVHPQSVHSQGYTLSVVDGGQVHVADGAGRYLRDAQVPPELSRALFTAIANGPRLNTLQTGSCSAGAHLNEPTYLRFGGIASPDLQCATSGFGGMLWAAVQQIIGSIGLGGLGGATGGNTNSAGSLGGLGDLGGLGNLGGLGGLLGGLGGLGGK